MIKTFSKYFFFVYFLLLLGNQQLYAYGLKSDKQTAKAAADLSNQEDFHSITRILSDSAASDQKLQHVIGEEKVEEEEERLNSADDSLGNDFLSTSLANALSSCFLLTLPKKIFRSHIHFSYFSSYKRYLRFEVFRI